MKKYITIPSTKVKLYRGAVLTISGYPNSKFMLCNDNLGWCLKDTMSPLSIRNISGKLLDHAMVISTGTATDTTPAVIPDSTKIDELSRTVDQMNQTINQLQQAQDNLAAHAIVDSGYTG